MPAPASCISYDNGGITYTSIEPQVETADFDTVQIEAVSATQYQFAKNTSIPGFNARVDRARSRRSGPYWIHEVTGVGLLDGASRLISQDAEDAEEGFDSGSETWAAADTAVFSLGRAHSLHANLRCISIKARKARVTGFKYFDLAFKGVRSGTRHDKFSFQTLTKETLRKNFIITLQGGDSLTPHDWNILLATPVLTRSYVSLSRPNATDVGAQGSGFGVAFPQTYTINATDTDLVYNWPNGVVLIGLNWEELPGTSICFVQEIFARRDMISLG